MTATEPSAAIQTSSSQLRVWLIALTIVAALSLVAAIPATLFATYMGAFAADDPSAAADAVWRAWVAIWASAAAFVVLLISGVAGGWIAYRKRRNRLSFGLSLLAAAPIALIVLAVAGFVIMNAVWTAAILR